MANWLKDDTPARRDASAVYLPHDPEGGSVQSDEDAAPGAGGYGSGDTGSTGEEQPDEEEGEVEEEESHGLEGVHVRDRYTSGGGGGGDGEGGAGYEAQLMQPAARLAQQLLQPLRQLLRGAGLCVPTSLPGTGRSA